MIVRLVSLVVATGCASLSARPAVTEGRTSDGMSYGVRGSGPTVVLIHGGVLDRRMWDHEAEAWASQFRVVRYDLRGHGKSADITVPYSSVDDLASVLGSRRRPGSIRLTALRPCRTIESVSAAGTEPAAELWVQPATQFIRFSHAPCAVSRCYESGRLHRRAERRNRLDRPGARDRFRRAVRKL